MPHTRFLAAVTLSCCALLSACCHPPKKASTAQDQPPPPKLDLVWHPVKTPRFTRINASENIRLQLAGSPSDAESVRVLSSHIIASVHDGTLFLMGAPGDSDYLKDYPVNVKVTAPFLDDIQLFHNASIEAKNMDNPHLNIEDYSSGDVTMTGVLGIRRIIQTRYGKINIRWLKTPDLTIMSDTGNVTIAGVAGRMRAKLGHHAILDAQQLRADNVWVSTEEHAVAQINPLNVLHAFATDHSSIGFYHHPKHSQVNVSDYAKALFIG